MDFETAREFIDNLLADKYGYINRYNSPAIIIEFIGGEPLMEIHLTRKIYEYFLEKCYESNHPWFHLHRLSICSNGMQYFDKDVQDFFKDYSQNISFNISIDGNKELHDACRIQPNGEGTYDIDMMALNHYATHYNPERNSKMTLAPANIKYLYDSVVDFISKGMRIINLNCVFEEGWNQSTAKEEYFQLKKLADYIIDNDMEHIYLSIFSERPEGPYSRENDNNYCGGSGSMLAMRPNGDFYPCIRYMPTSVGPDVPDLCIGNVRDGMDGRQEGSEVLKMLDAITRRSQNNDICYDCPIGNNCASCLALGHTVFGTPDKRATFICIQHIAECLANVYYWNRLNLKHPEYQLGVRKNMVPDEWARLVVDDDELVELKLLECFSMVSTMESASGTT
jgi:radical SAM peptide maturase (CXXX-repeat target family)